MIKTIKDFKFSVAIDGGAASGKSTASKIIAKHFNFKLLNSGRLYRFLAFNLIKDNNPNIQNMYYNNRIKRTNLIMKERI